MSLAQKCARICAEVLPVTDQVPSDSYSSLKEEPKDSNEKSPKNYIYIYYSIYIKFIYIWFFF